MKCHRMYHFIRVCTVCYKKDKIDLQRKKYNNFLEIMTCDPSVYRSIYHTMNKSDFTVCQSTHLGDSSLQSVNGPFKSYYIKLDVIFQSSNNFMKKNCFEQLGLIVFCTRFQWGICQLKCVSFLHLYVFCIL